MRNLSDERCGESQKARFVTSNFFSENRDIYDVMLKNTVELDMPQMTIWRICIAF
jgi:hypothetical protein